MLSLNSRIFPSHTFYQQNKNAATAPKKAPFRPSWKRAACHGYHFVASDIDTVPWITATQIPSLAQLVVDLGLLGVTLAMLGYYLAGFWNGIGCLSEQSFQMPTSGTKLPTGPVLIPY